MNEKFFITNFDFDYEEKEYFYTKNFHPIYN